MRDDAEFEEWFAGRIARVPGVVAVALGGSRARGEARADSDWDLSLYYRGSFDLAALRAELSGYGELSGIGGWPGVMNGGGNLDVEGRPLDLHYRDLEDIEYRAREAEEGRFDVQRLPFYLAGMPTYLPLAELAIGRTVVGELPRSPFPPKLREEAQRRWHEAAGWSLRYAMRSLRQRRDTVVAAGNLARGLIEESHARLAGRGEWVVNEKSIVERAGLGGAVELLHDRGLSVAVLLGLVAEVGALLDLDPDPR